MPQQSGYQEADWLLVIQRRLIGWKQMVLMTDGTRPEPRWRHGLMMLLFVSLIHEDSSLLCCTHTGWFPSHVRTSHLFCKLSFLLKSWSSEEEQWSLTRPLQHFAPQWFCCSSVFSCHRLFIWIFSFISVKPQEEEKQLLFPPPVGRHNAGAQLTDTQPELYHEPSGLTHTLTHTHQDAVCVLTVL